MNQQQIVELAATTRDRRQRAARALAESSLGSRAAAEDQLAIWEAVANRVTARSRESDVRGAISDLRLLMSRSLDAAAFMTAEELIEMMRGIIGDTYVDTGSVDRSEAEAVEFLARSISADSKDRFRDDILAGKGGLLRDNFRLGMSVRNTLRSAGYDERSLNVSNLDDVWYRLFEKAVGVGETTNSAVHPNAPELVSLARLFAEGVREPLARKYPALFAMDEAQQWGFFCTVACAWTACFSLHHSVPEVSRGPTELRVRQDLAAWHPASVDALEDLQEFVIEKLRSETDRSKRGGLFEIAVATWIVWNITQKRSIPREFQSIAGIAGTAVPEFMNYWTASLDTG